MADFLPLTEATIERWHEIAVPNAPAGRLAADLADAIAAFAAVRGSLRFEDEPASFEAVLVATMDRAP